MRFISIALLCLFSASSAFANSKTNENALSILKRIEWKQQKIRNELQQSLIKILQPGVIRQGEAYSLYFQSNTEVTGTNSLIDLHIDGAPVLLEQPAKGLFIFHSNGESEVKTHNAVAKLSIEDSAESKSLRDAIQQLDLEIQALQDQIDETEPGEEQDALIAAREEKIAIKNQLIAALAGIKTPIGEEAFSFKITSAAGNNPNFFRIQSVSPSFGPVEGGTELTVTGKRFPTGMEALLGGVSVPLTYVSSTEVKITSPNFTASGGVGLKDLELKKVGASPEDPTKNATRNGVFYAAQIAAPPAVNVKPVAVAGAAQSVAMNAEVILNGSGSYDQNPNTTLSYAWRAISVPAGSGIDTGVVHSTLPSFSFQPAMPGSYVWELVVSDGEFSSEPSLTVVTANPPANSAPAPTAPAINVGPNASATSQVQANDADSAYQAVSYVIVKQASLGTASVNGQGLVSFTAGSVEGSDSIEVKVIDNGNPPLSGTVSIPVTVVASEVSIGVMGHYVRIKDGLIQVGLYASPTVSTGGQITSIIWSFGDGTSAKSIDTFGDAFISHDYLSAGTYEVSVTATDSLGATATKNHTIVVNNEPLPVVKFTADQVSGPVPLTVTFDGSSSTSSETITNYRWVWNDGTPMENNLNPVNTHTFTNPGVYRVRLRVYGQDNNIDQAEMDIYAGVTPPAGGSRPWANFNPGTKEVLFNSPHTFTTERAFDPNPNGGLVNFSWDYGDWASCGGSGNGCLGTGATTQYTYPGIGSYWPRLTVENLGGRSIALSKEVIVINTGHAPRAMPNIPMNYQPYEGVAPATIDFDGSQSFDYDGTITNYNWWFGDPACVDDCGAQGVFAQHTYTEPGVFGMNLFVADNDGNAHQAGQTVVIYPSLKVKKENEKKKRASDYEREQRRHMLSQACFRGEALACNEVGVMYQEDGNQFAAGKFFEKACALGYSAACSFSKR